VVAYTQRIKKIGLLFQLLGTILFCSMACSPATADSLSEGIRIEVGPGPEDMVLDTLHTPRLLISCSARREEYKPYGEIESLDLLSMERQILTRYNEPDSILFHPHGIFLDKELLYVISHEREPDIHPILIYRVHSDSLVFLERISAGLMNSPNALVTGEAGEIYLVNDSGKRGSILEKALKLKRANVVKLEKDSLDLWSSQYMAIDLGYPAGINRIGNKIYAGDAILNQVHVYQISENGLKPLPPIKGLKGNDNLRIKGRKILTCCHIKPLRFIGHAKNPEKHSPVEVFLVNPNTGESKSIFKTDGSQISGASTAIIFEDKLYISQVFEPYLLQVKL
jgi:arylesterase/paraoxonase